MEISLQKAFVFATKTTGSNIEKFLATIEIYGRLKTAWVLENRPRWTSKEPVALREKPLGG